MNTTEIINVLGSGFSAEEIAKIAKIAAQIEQRVGALRATPKQEEYAIVATPAPKPFSAIRRCASTRTTPKLRI